MFWKFRALNEKVYRLMNIYNFRREYQTDFCFEYANAHFSSHEAIARADTCRVQCAQKN